MSISRVEAGAGTTHEALGVLRGSAGFIAIAIAVAGLGFVSLGLIASRGSEPLLLTLLASFAALGVFFVFGVLAGHIRLTARTTLDDAARAIAENLREGVQITGRDGRVTYANSTMLGMYPEGATHRMIEQVFAGEPQGEEAVFRLMRAAERGEGHSEEFEVHRVPGTTGPGWVSVSVAPIGGAVGGEPHRHVLLWRVADISATRRREADARRIGDRVLASYDDLPAGLLYVGADGRVAHANRTLQSWLGLENTRAPMTDVRVADILTPDSLALVTSHAAPAAVPSASISTSSVSAAGGFRPVSSPFPIRTAAGRPSSCTVRWLPHATAR